MNLQLALCLCTNVRVQLRSAKTKFMLALNSILGLENHSIRTLPNVINLGIANNNYIHTYTRIFHFLISKMSPRL